MSVLGKRALVVEDSATARKLLVRALEDLGFQVIQAENGADALAVIEREAAIDVALVDWNMPVLDGIAFVRKARQGKLAGTPMMMVTTESTLSQVKVALECGVEEFLMKPFEPEMLRDKLAILGFDLPS